MAELVVTYEEQSIVSLNASATKVLKTAGKMMTDDVTIVYTRPDDPTYEDPTITVAATGVVTASANGKTSTHTLSSTDDADFIAANIKTGITVFGVEGTFTSDATAAAGDILASKTAYVNGLKVTGSIVTKTDTGNVSLTAQGATKSYAAGYYPNAHGAVVALTEQTGGDVTLDGTTTSKTYAAGYYSAAHTVSVVTYTGTVEAG